MGIFYVLNDRSSKVSVSDKPLGHYLYPWSVVDVIFGVLKYGRSGRYTARYFD